ncbi:ATP-binding protein [Streptomyces sp. NPDC086023]|uniref:ATP-binding protein n=1 Tax=Streptomyces sp. NPDC086023 TaxID=3365746 RepID=UPI0037D2634A
MNYTTESDRFLFCGAEFTQRFSSTPRGARLARRLAASQLDAWGIPYGGAESEAAVAVVAELAANAATHGRVQGRGFRLRMAVDGPRLRIEVTDTRGEVLPVPAPGPGRPYEEGGRGLLIVGALAEAWGTVPRADGGPGKTVWALVGLGPGPRAAPRSAG